MDRLLTKDSTPAKMLSMTVKKTATVPVEATMNWAAPAKYFFIEGEVPPGMNEDQVLEAIYSNTLDFLRRQPSLEALIADYNLSAAVDFNINGQMIYGADEDEPDEGQGRVEITVSVKGQMEPKYGAGAMKSWGMFEIFDELRDSSDLNGDLSRFQVHVAYRD